MPCLDAGLGVAAGIFSQMDVAPDRDRLDVVAPVLQQMSWALTRVVGSMWGTNDIDVCLGPLIEHVAGAPDCLIELQEAAAREGACLVLSWLRSGYPEVSTHVVATSIPENRRLAGFFKEVEEAIMMAAADCELDVSMVQHEKVKHVLAISGFR